jgi:Cof subfamily protein (haloacid dehalogenase superfamily)
MSKVSLVISDVDGTLVRTDKSLSQRSRDAVDRLHEAGIGFSIVSSRPPFGVRMLVEALSLRLPLGAFNGGMLVSPDLQILEQQRLAPDAATEAIRLLRASGVGVWTFTGERWMTEDRNGAHVEHEIHTILTQPTIVSHLEDHLEGIGKIVGVTDDYPRLDRDEPVLREALGDRASVARSQAYYLDVTPPGTNKGTAVAGMVRRLGVDPSEIVTLGDMENDLSMFRQSGFSIAMGNASAEVKSAANAVTRSNDEDGFAAAIEELVLPRARQSGAKGGG